MAHPTIAFSAGPDMRIVPTAFAASEYHGILNAPETPRYAELTKNEQTKPESPELAIPNHGCQPSKAELEEDLRVDATFEELVKRVLRPLKIRCVKPPKRK